MAAKKKPVTPPSVSAAQIIREKVPAKPEVPPYPSKLRPQHHVSPFIRTIKTRIRYCLNGNIVIPDFQRPFVWSDGQILYLIDSIMSGYPIGNLLTWEQHGRPSTPITIAGIECAPSQESCLYLIDGQQRTGALLRAFVGNGFAFDFRHEKLVKTYEVHPDVYPLNLWLKPIKERMAWCAAAPGDGDGKYDFLDRMFDHNIVETIDIPARWYWRPSGE